GHSLPAPRAETTGRPRDHPVALRNQSYRENRVDTGPLDFLDPPLCETSARLQRDRDPRPIQVETRARPRLALEDARLRRVSVNGWSVAFLEQRQQRSRGMRRQILRPRVRLGRFA